MRLSRKLGTAAFPVALLLASGAVAYGTGSILHSDSSNASATPAAGARSFVQVETPDGTLQVTPDMAAEVPLASYSKVGAIGSYDYWTGPGATEGAQCVLAIGHPGGTLLGCNDGAIFQKQGLAIVFPSGDGARLEGAAVLPGSYATVSARGTTTRSATARPSSRCRSARLPSRRPGRTSPT